MGSGRARHFTLNGGAVRTDQRALLLRRAAASEDRGLTEPAEGPCASSGKALLFVNLMEWPGKELGAGHMHQATFYLASSLRGAGVPVVFADLKISRFSAEDSASRAGLDAVLDANPDVNWIGLTLCDAYFEKAAELMRYLRARTRAWLAVGGIMPTHHPREVFVHLPEADFVVRGAGELAAPRLLRILGGRFRDAGLAPKQAEALRGLNGVISCDAESVIWAGAEEVLRVANLDASALDFSLLEREHVASGQAWSLSRGCHQGCSFCTSMDKGRFVGKSPGEVGRLMAAYGRRLKELYGAWSSVPAAAFGIGFYDDDFFADADRAVAILRIFARGPFFVRFLQTGINAFYRGASTQAPDARLMDALRPELFDQRLGADCASLERIHVYLGTESFSDTELERLGKGYGFARVRRLAEELSSRGVRQAHHFIATNARTRIEDLTESVARLVELRRACGPAFNILEPVIPRLCSFYGTPSWRGLVRDRLTERVMLRGRLSCPGYPEFDYPLVERDMPVDRRVASFAERIEGRTNIDWESELRELASAASGRA